MAEAAPYTRKAKILVVPTEEHGDRWLIEIEGHGRWSFGKGEEGMPPASAKPGDEGRMVCGE